MNPETKKSKVTTMKVTRSVHTKLKRAAKKAKSDLFPFSDSVITSGLKTLSESNQ